jgi:hypothetical protein
MLHSSCSLLAQQTLAMQIVPEVKTKEEKKKQAERNKNKFI